MHFFTQHHFWTIPVCKTAPETVFKISGKDRQYEYALKIRAAAVADADFVATSSIPAYFERELNIECDNQALLNEIRLTDSPFDSDGYAGPHRQQFHFSSRTGFLNDPNGLFYFQGTYHLFFQHHPFGVYGAQQHWGHAISSDLVHWQEKGQALFPRGTSACWSGSAFVDTENVSGLGIPGGPSPILLFFTSADSGCFSQNIAYSVDGGENFIPYRRNPVLISQGDGDDRDPSIAYDAECREFLMCLFLGETSRQFGMFRSDDLLHWQEFQRFSFPGEGCECPDLFSIRDEATGRVRWVLIEANGHYLLGDRNGKDGTFVWNTGGTILNRQDYLGPYAGQSFQNVPDGKRYYMAWHWDHTRTRETSQAMTLPVELKLRGERLLVFPVEALKTLRCETYRFSAPAFQVRLRELPVDSGDLWELEIVTPPDEEIHLNFGGVPIAFDGKRRELRIASSVITYPDGETYFRGRIFLDRNTVDLFDHAGRFMLCVSVDRHSSRPVEFGDLWKTNRLRELTVHRLKSIWQF